MNISTELIWYVMSSFVEFLSCQHMPKEFVTYVFEYMWHYAKNRDFAFSAVHDIIFMIFSVPCSMNFKATTENFEGKAFSIIFIQQQHTISIRFSKCVTWLNYLRLVNQINLMFRKWGKINFLGKISRLSTVFLFLQHFMYYIF